MNRLGQQLSPYLRRHASDPIDWQPWDAEALAAARQEDKPVMLVIGYAASHLCRQMARESFESTQTAKLLNEKFVSILVDREERPDLDRIYQSIYQLLNRKTGTWPLVVFLDPADQLPFYAGTYFPPQDTDDLPGFRTLLKGMVDIYAKNDDQTKAFKAKMQEALAPIPGSSHQGAFDLNLLDRACGQIDASFNARYGGFGEAPKFPHPAGLGLMLHASAYLDEPQKVERLDHMLDFTLAAMARGGLYDHVGGGFFNATVDDAWDIPQFEKTLATNGLLLSIYAQRAQRTGSELFRRTAIGTAEWMVRELKLDCGAFGAGLMTAPDGKEGDAYVWSIAELREALGEAAEPFIEIWCASLKANFGSRWHLHLAAPKADRDDWHDLPAAEATAGLEVLRAARAVRSPASCDSKVVTASNAIAVRGLVDAGELLDRADFVAAAAGAVDYLRATHWRDGRLAATSLDGSPGANAFLGDYAFLIDALLALLDAQPRDQDLAFAVDLADRMIADFEDPTDGGFHFTANDHEPLIQRTKPWGDDALPAGNGVAVRALLKLGRRQDQPRYLETAEKALRAGVADVERWPSAHATMLRAVLDISKASAQ